MPPADLYTAEPMESLWVKETCVPSPDKAEAVKRLLREAGR